MNNKDYYIYIEVILILNNAVRWYEDSRSDYDFLNLYAISFRTIYRYWGCHPVPYLRRAIDECTCPGVPRNIQVDAELDGAKRAEAEGWRPVPGWVCACLPRALFGHAPMAVGRGARAYRY